ncbi:MAG TPA: hypothetical protein VNZ52_01575 [Candidatus Thermoplasmatota archaeon]|nr:hypothetical protein [Candidatus Thermoplasmatota archaeon]
MTIEEEEERGTVMMPGGESPKEKEQQAGGIAQRARDAPIPEDLLKKNTQPKPFYGNAKDPEALYDKRRILDEG